jgi:hypothetical protein
MLLIKEVASGGSPEGPAFEKLGKQVFFWARFAI